MTDTDELLTTTVAAARLGVSVSTVYALVRRGELDAIRMGSRPGAVIKVPASAITKFRSKYRSN